MSVLGTQATLFLLQNNNTEKKLIDIKVSK